MKQKTVFIGSAVVLLAVFVIGVLVYDTQRTEQSASVAQANRAALVRFHSPSLGDANAKVQIVEFLDPACETCRSFYPFVKNLMAANPGRIQLFVRYAPFHQGSDEVVKMLEAARKQGKYWEALEAVFATQSQWVQNHRAQPQLAFRSLGGLGLDLAQVKSDMNAPELARLIEQDLADARTLNVTKTPEFFVNGKPMPSFGYQQLKNLVDEALNSAYRS
jgi:protein-disulfide isomerase